jgi:hypothetical protein
MLELSVSEIKLRTFFSSGGGLASFEAIHFVSFHFEELSIVRCYGNFCVLGDEGVLFWFSAPSLTTDVTLPVSVAVCL